MNLLKENRQYTNVANGTRTVANTYGKNGTSICLYVYILLIN